MPDVVDGDRITADPDQLRSAGREWSRKASDYGAQVSTLQKVSNQLPKSAFAGASGDVMRLYVSELTASASSLGQAYSRIAVAAPQVAESIRDAKEAQAKRDRTKRAAAEARKELTAAEDELNRAQTLLASQSALKAIAGVGHGPTAAAEHAVEVATRKVDAARTADTEATRKATRAADDFRDSDESRRRKSEAFAHLVDEQTAVIRSNLPGAPSAPQIPAVAAQIKTLSRGKTALKTLVDLQKDAIKKHLNPLDGNGNPLRALGVNEKKVLEAVDRWGKRVSLASKGLTVAAPLAISTIEALNDPKLSAKEKQQYIVNHTLLEGGGGLAGGVLCGPAGPVASAACGTAGGMVGKELEKSRTIQRATNALSDNVVSPVVEPFSDLAHLRPAEAAKDVVTAPLKIAISPAKVAVDTVAHPGKVVDAGADVVHDAKGVGGYLDDKADNFFSGLSRGLRGGR